MAPHAQAAQAGAGERLARIQREVPDDSQLMRIGTVMRIVTRRTGHGVGFFDHGGLKTLDPNIHETFTRVTFQA